MTAYNTYDIGDVVRVSAAFLDSSDLAADPTGVVVSYRNPSSGVVTTLTYGVDVEVVKDSIGNYHVDITTAAHGRYTYKWVGTGAVAATVEGFFHVRESNVL